jgi:hypothetical protein
VPGIFALEVIEHLPALVEFSFLEVCHQFLIIGIVFQVVLVPGLRGDLVVFQVTAVWSLNSGGFAFVISSLHVVVYFQ